MNPPSHKSLDTKLLLILCSSLPALLVTGPFLPDLIISFLSIWFIFYCIKNNYYDKFKNKYFCFFLFFWIVCVVSSLFSSDILFSLKSSFFYIRIGLFALLISFIIDQNKKFLQSFYLVLLITFIILLFDGYYQFFFKENLIGFKIYNVFRVTSFFDDEQILGSYLSRFFPLLFALFVIQKRNKFELGLIFILFFFTYILVFLSGERAAFILMNLSVLFIILFISKYKYLRLIVFILSLFVISHLALKNDKIYDRYISNTVQGMGLDGSKKHIFSPIHDSMIRTAFNMFLDKPVLGHGPRSFRIKCQNPRYAEGIHPCSTHPHNFYVQLLAETGMIGFLFLVGIFFHFLFLITKFLKNYFISKRILFSDYQICLLAGLLITIWPITTNGNLFNNYLMMLYGIPLGFFRKL